MKLNVTQSSLRKVALNMLLTWGPHQYEAMAHRLSWQLRLFVQKFVNQTTNLINLDIKMTQSTLLVTLLLKKKATHFDLYTESGLDDLHLEYNVCKNQPLTFHFNGHHVYQVGVSYWYR